MSTARNIPTAIPELDYGEPPRNKEPRRSRSRSLRSVANLVLGKQNTKASSHESNPPAPTTRWPSISALRRSQKNTLPPHPEETTSAGDASANADLYTRDRRSADMPRRRFSLSRPIRLSLNLARPAKRGAPEAEPLESEVAEARQDMDAYGPARRGMDAYTHSHDLRRRLEELEVDGASTQVLADDASSRAAGSVELSLLDGDGGEASLLEVDGGEASSLEVDGAEASPLAVDGVGPALLAVDIGEASPLAVDGAEASSLEVDGVDPPLLESACVDPPLLESDGVEPSLFELDAEPGQVEDPSHDATDPSLVQARASLVNIDAAAHVDAAVLANDGKPWRATDFEVDSEQVDSKQINSAKGQPTSPHVAPIASPRVAPLASPHVAFAEHVVEYGPGLLDLVHSCYEDGGSSGVDADGDEDGYHDNVGDGYHGTDEEVYHGDEDGYHDLDDGYHSTDEEAYHGDDELLYSSDDEDFYAYPPNAMFGVSRHSSSTASGHSSSTASGHSSSTASGHSSSTASGHSSRIASADVPIFEAHPAVASCAQVELTFTSRIPVTVPFTSRIPVAVPFTSRTPVTYRAPAAILPPAAPSVPDDACEHHTPQYDHLTPQYEHHAPQYEHHTPQYDHHAPQYDHHTPQYAAFFSESPSSYDVAMDFLPLSDLEGTPVDEVGATFDEGEVYSIGNDEASDIDVQVGSDSEADLIFPDEASFPIDPVIYETKEGGRAWKEEDMPLWTGDVPLEPSLEASLETSLETPLMSMLETPLESSFDMPLEPSFDVPQEPLLGPLLQKERGVWRDDEAIPLPPLQMDCLPWLEGSDEEESPLSPIEGADSPASFGAELPTLMAESPPLAALNEKLAVDEDERFGADEDEPFDADTGNFPAGDNADFALFPTDPRSLPYLLRLSPEYDGTPASELNGSPFPSPLTRSPYDENVLPFADASALPFADASALPFADASALPFASLSAQEIATGHQLVRRGRAGVVARRVVVERRSSQAQGDMTAQVDGTTQIESAARVESAALVESTARLGSLVQVDPTVLVDIAASSPLDVFLPHVQTPASAPELLEFFPTPSPFGDLSDGLQSSQSRALVRRPTEGEMAVVPSFPTLPSPLPTFSALSL
ncbi:hypothetical protein EV715DRAFT_297802 [Schizophyllum commune]